QFWLGENLGFKLHSKLSWSSVSVSTSVSDDFFCDPHTSSGTRVANGTVGGWSKSKRTSVILGAKRSSEFLSSCVRKRCHMMTCPLSDALLSRRFFPARSA